MIPAALGRSYFLPVLSGILAALALDVSFLWFLAFVALIPFLRFMHDERNQSVRKICFGGLLFGSVFSAGVFIWFFSMHPLTWAGIANPTVSIIVTFALWLVSAFVSGLFYAAWAFLFWFARPGNAILAGIFGSSLWILLEYARSVGFLFLWSAPETLVGPHFTLGSLGYALAGEYGFLQLASIGGVYLLSFLAVLANMLMFSAFSMRASRRVRFLWVLGVLAVLVALSFALRQYAPAREIPQGDQVRIALVTTDFAPRFFTTGGTLREREAFYGGILATLKDLGGTPNIVVLPESAMLLASMGNNASSTPLFQREGMPNALFVDSTPAIGANLIKHQVMLYFNPTDRGSLKAQYKNLLVPGGEFMPTIVRWASRAIGGGNWASRFVSARGFRSGNDVNVAEAGGVKIGSLFCSETMSGFLYRDLVDKGAEVLVSAASHSFAHGSPIVFQQNLNMAKVRAVENDRYFIQATNMNPSFVLSNTGRVVKMGERGGGILYGKVPQVQTRSLYGRFGDVIVLFSVLFVIIFLIMAVKRKEALPHSS